MFRQKQWNFKGGSGKDYTFEIFKKKADFPTSGGVYIFAYTHLKGHIAGFAVNTLHIGQTDNLKKMHSAPPHQQCLITNCWNCTYVLHSDEDIQNRQTIVEDLLKANPTLC